MAPPPSSSSYPFVGTPQAQSDYHSSHYQHQPQYFDSSSAPPYPSNGGDSAYGYGDYASNRTAAAAGGGEYSGHQYNGSGGSGYGGNNNNNNNNNYGNADESTFYEDDDRRWDMANVTSPNREHFDEKTGIAGAGAGATVGSAAVAGGGGMLHNRMSTYGSRRDSIFSQQDRHVFFKRSVPVRALRSIFCILIWTIIMILTVVLLIVLFAQPPNVALLSINVPDASDYQVTGSRFSANGSLNFAISNPNSFSATIQHINANLYDAHLGQSASIGNGTLRNQKIEAGKNTTIVFPFDVGIDLSSDADALISDVAQTCGLSGTSGGDGTLDVLINVDARISVLSVGVNIPIQRNQSFACPTSALQSVIGSLTGSAGSAASALSGILGGNNRRDDGSGSSGSAQIAQVAHARPTGGIVLPAVQSTSQQQQRRDEISRQQILRGLVAAFVPEGLKGRRRAAAVVGAGAGNNEL
ncbi:unnamed protein product [Jaminaea pallidilutea]